MANLDFELSVNTKRSLFRVKKQDFVWLHAFRWTNKERTKKREKERIKIAFLNEKRNEIESKKPKSSNNYESAKSIENGKKEKLYKSSIRQRKNDRERDVTVNWKQKKMKIKTSFVEIIKMIFNPFR